MNIKEERLLNFGVSSSHLLIMKHKRPLPYPLFLLYDDGITVQHRYSVPLHDIKGGSRLESDISWYDNFINVLNKDHKMCISGRKIDDKLDWIKKVGLENFKKEVQLTSSDNIKLSYYDNIDAYFVDEGNHRITVAKMIGMKEIFAEVTKYSFKTEYDEAVHILNWKRKMLFKNLKALHFFYQFKFNGDLEIYFNDVYIGKFSIPKENETKDSHNVDEALMFLDKLTYYKQIRKTAKSSWFSKILFAYFIKKLFIKDRYLMNRIEALNKLGYFN